MKRYIALTIGPIYKTLNSAKKTRDLWGGSYLFSFVMKQIISKFKDRAFIVPFVGDDIFKQSEVGLFHDRFIFEAQSGDKTKLEDVVDDIVTSLENKMKIEKDFLKNYLQISIVEKELEDGENPILKLTPYLDSKELFFKVSQYDKNLLQERLQGDNVYLKKEAFGENRSFASLPEIALSDIITDDIRKKINSDDELTVYEDDEVKKVLKPYHKYIAIVHADGDNMGKVVESLKTEDDYTNFSKNLFNYCSISHKLIKEYGGETIFAGGDDLLFFAPVVKDDKTIFNLTDDISTEFDKLFKDANIQIKETGKQATLSFGVSITYYKFPLYEALEKSRDLLFCQAKSKEKNNIAFILTKHSGQSFGGILPKSNKDIYKSF
jgi:CRISPR-associated protein Cmr2